MVGAHPQGQLFSQPCTRQAAIEADVCPAFVQTQSTLAVIECLKIN